MARQGSDFDVVESDAVKGRPGGQGINGLFEPSLGSASSYHGNGAIRVGVGGGGVLFGQGADDGLVAVVRRYSSGCMAHVVSDG